MVSKPAWYPSIYLSIGLTTNQVSIKASNPVIYALSSNYRHTVQYAVCRPIYVKINIGTLFVRDTDVLDTI